MLPARGRAAGRATGRQAGHAAEREDGRGTGRQAGRAELQAGHTAEREDGRAERLDGRAERQAGRASSREVPLRHVILGIDFGASKIATAACGPDGTRLASRTVPTKAGSGARAVFDRGVSAARGLLTDTAAGSELAAVGVSTVGIPFADRVELAPTISGWDNFALGEELHAAFAGAEIRLATDVKAAARAEACWGALAGCDPAVYLNLGTGLAAAVVVGGQVLAGSHGAAGEIGYNLRGIDDVGLAINERTLLEHMVSGQALSHRATQTLRRRADAAEILRSSSTLSVLVDEFVAELAFHLVNLAILVDPQRIAVGGGMVGSWERLRPGLEAALAAGVPFPPELVVAAFPFDAPLMGAIALAAEAAAELPGMRGDGANDPANPEPAATAGASIQH